MPGGIVPSSPDRPRGWGPPERGAVGRLDAWGLRRRGGGRCDFLCFAYSALGPVVSMGGPIDHCYVLWICEVYLHIKRAQIPLSSAMLIDELDMHVDISENPSSSPQPLLDSVQISRMPV